MDLKSFLDRIIDDGIIAATADYNDAKDKSRLSGSIKGFEACRDKTTDQLIAAWREANESLRSKMDADNLDDYWYWNCYQMEIEWVLNCLSVAINKPLLGHLPTARGVMKAAEVLGVGTGVSE